MKISNYQSANKFRLGHLYVNDTNNRKTIKLNFNEKKPSDYLKRIAKIAIYAIGILLLTSAIFYASYTIYKPPKNPQTYEKNNPKNGPASPNDEKKQEDFSSTPEEPTQPKFNASSSKKTSNNRICIFSSIDNYDEKNMRIKELTSSDIQKYKEVIQEHKRVLEGFGYKYFVRPIESLTKPWFGSWDRMTKFEKDLNSNNEKCDYFVEIYDLSKLSGCEKDFITNYLNKPHQGIGCSSILSSNCSYSYKFK